MTSVLYRHNTGTAWLMGNFREPLGTPPSTAQLLPAIPTPAAIWRAGASCSVKKGKASRAAGLGHQVLAVGASRTPKQPSVGPLLGSGRGGVGGLVSAPAGGAWGGSSSTM